MHTYTRLLFCAVVVAGFMSACGNDAGLPGINPSVAVSSPGNNATINVPANKQIAIDFNTNYMISAPGTCGAQANCGHVYVLVDNANCNSVNLTYNTLASASPTFADLSKCTTATGVHTILLQLRHNDGTQVNNLVGSPVTTQVMFTAQ